MSRQNVGNIYASLTLEAAEFDSSAKKATASLSSIERAADRLKSTIDPIYGAQSKFNKAMAEANRLFEAGAIDKAQLAKAEAYYRSQLEATTAALTKTAGASRAAQQNMRNLGYQVSDIGVQFSMGTNPFMILAQQGPQVANALEGARGAIGRFASFLSGPFGAALLAGVSIVGVFASKMWAAKKAAEDGAKGAQTLKEATEELDRVTGRANKTKEQEIRLAAEATRKKYDEAIATREQVKAELEKNKAVLDAMTGVGGIALGISPEAAQLALGRIQKINDKLKEQDKQIADARLAMRGAEMANAMQAVSERMDAAAAATAKYERAHAKLKATYEAVGSTMSPEEFARREEALRRVRDAEIQAANDAEKARKARQKADEKALKDAEKLAKQHLDKINRAVDSLLVERAAVAANKNVIALLDEAMARGIISAEEYTLAIRRANAELRKIEGTQLGIERLDVSKMMKPKVDKSYIEGKKKEYEEARKLAVQAEKDAMQQATIFTAALDSAFNAAIFSGKSLGDVFKGLVNDIGQMAIKMLVLQPIIEAVGKSIKSSFGGAGIFSLFGVGGKRAFGGPVTAGTPYLVGERGPEVFMPSSHGRIIPNGALQSGGNMGVYVQPSPYFDVVVKKISGQVSSETTMVGSMGAVAETDRRAAYRSKTSLVGY